MAVRAVVPEDDANPVALGHPQAWAGHAAIVGPGREEDARRDLDLLVLADDLEGPQRAAVRQGRDDPGVPVGQERCGVEPVAGAVDVADRDHIAMGAVATARLRVGGRRRTMPRMRALAARRHCAEQGAAGRGEAAPEKVASVDGLSQPVAHGKRLFSLLQGICNIAPISAVTQEISCG